MRNAAADRTFIVQDKIKQIMRENPGMTYTDAWSTANALPELAATFAAMQTPNQGEVVDAVADGVLYKAVSEAISGALTVLIKHMTIEEANAELEAHATFKPLYKFWRANTPEGLTTQNAARVPKTPAARNAVIQSAVSKLMSEGKSYDEAWNLVKAHPETKPLFDAMDDPSGPAAMRKAYPALADINVLNRTTV